MENYKEKYLRLFNEVTKTIEQLQEVQLECEEMFIECDKAKKTESIIE